jgi:hypothetical protein
MNHDTFPQLTRYLSNDFATFALQNGRVIGMNVGTGWLVNEEAAFTVGPGMSIVPADRFIILADEHLR